MRRSAQGRIYKRRSPPPRPSRSFHGTFVQFERALRVFGGLELFRGQIPKAKKINLD